MSPDATKPEEVAAADKIVVDGKMIATTRSWSTLVAWCRSSRPRWSTRGW